MAFTPPSDLTPYKPENNKVTLTPVVPSAGGPATDEYSLSPAPIVPPATPAHANMFVSHGTPVDKVQKQADCNNAWWKFLLATVNPQPPSQPDTQAATMWFMQHIGRPMYGL